MLSYHCQGGTFARAARYEEQTAARRTARPALQRVTENPDATPAELLEAALF